MNYRSMSTEGIEALIGELRDILREKQGEPTKATLQSILKQFGKGSPDFCGTGLTLEELMLSQGIKRMQNAFWMQERSEQKRRLDFIIRLSAEYQRILEKTIQSTGIARAAIEDVIDGDWEGLRISREMFTFEGEHQDAIDRYAPIFAEFVRIIDEALQTIPVVAPEPTVTS